MLNEQSRPATARSGRHCGGTRLRCGSAAVCTHPSSSQRPLNLVPSANLQRPKPCRLQPSHSPGCHESTRSSSRKALYAADCCLILHRRQDRIVHLFYCRHDLHSICVASMSWCLPAFRTHSPLYTQAYPGRCHHWRTRRRPRLRARRPASCPDTCPHQETLTAVAKDVNASMLARPAAAPRSPHLHTAGGRTDGTDCHHGCRWASSRQAPPVTADEEAAAGPVAAAGVPLPHILVAAFQQAAACAWRERSFLSMRSFFEHALVFCAWRERIDGQQGCCVAAGDGSRRPKHNSVCLQTKHPALLPA